MSLLSRLKQIADPRSRHRREYPLWGLLAIVILAAAHGENSLRGMWQWAQHRSSILMQFRPLGLWGNSRFPCLGTFWYLLSKLPAGEIERALRGWGGDEETYAMDGKTLRGSKRLGADALQVVTMVGHCLRQLMAQEGVEGGDELAAALRLLEAEDVEGKVVSADAGLLKAPFVQKVVEKRGGISA